MASAAPVKVSLPFVMSPLSFRSTFPNVLARSGLLALAAGACLAGCGGGPSKPASQTVEGAGFQFQAPASWVVTRSADTTAAVGRGVDRTEVIRFALVRPYRPALFAASARELDGVMARLARQLSGRVVSSATVRLAGGAARSYRVVYGAGRTQEIGFVLSGDREYELLCRRRVSEPDTACVQLFGSFTLASG